MKLVVLQPSFLPWLGYWDQYAWSDCFVLYDDVQFDKNGWRNRNRILTPQGIHWLTIPVQAKGLPPINQVEVDFKQNWRHKHLQAIRQAYSKAAHFGWLFPSLEEYYQQEWPRLLDWNLAGLRLFTQILGLPWKVQLASQLGVAGHKTDRLIGLCQHLGASHYLTGDAARDYLELDKFEQIGVEVLWHGYQHPSYRQRGGEFVPYLSLIDLLFWNGPASLDILWQTGRGL